MRRERALDQPSGPSDGSDTGSEPAVEPMTAFARAMRDECQIYRLGHRLSLEMEKVKELTEQNKILSQEKEQLI